MSLPSFEYLNQDLDPVRLATVVVIIAVTWFLPTLLAIVLHRQGLKFTAVANVLCLFSHFLWFALLLWVISGKVASKKLKSLMDKRPPGQSQ